MQIRRIFCRIEICTRTYNFPFEKKTLSEKQSFYTVNNITENSKYYVCNYIDNSSVASAFHKKILELYK